MRRDHRFLFGCAAGAVLLLLIIFGVTSFGDQKKGDLVVAFSGLGPPLGPWPDRPTAVFELVNAASYSVMVRVQSVERQDASMWIPDAAPPVSATVKARRTRAFPVPISSTNSTWRITLRCQEGVRGDALQRVSDSFAELTGKAPSVQYSGRVYFVTNQTGPGGVQVGGLHFK